MKNATTGKPSAGDEVVLLKLGQGMEEAGRTKTDAKGEFSFKLDDAQSPHLVRAIHQDVTYHRMAPPGTTSVEIEVYDVAKKVDGIEVVADIMRVQAEQGQIAVTREFGVQNTSKPPRTQMNERNLEFYVPDGAQIIEDRPRPPPRSGNPLKSAPVPEGEKNRYSFIFPLRPGLTRFEVTYQLPYSGSANLDPKSMYPLEHFVVMLPKAMQFTAAAARDRLQADQLSERARRQRAGSFEHHAGPEPCLQNFRRRHCSKPGRKAAPRLERRGAESAAPRPAHSPTTVPVEDLVRRSTLPIRCRNIAGGYWAASPRSW